MNLSDFVISPKRAFVLKHNLEKIQTKLGSRTKLLVVSKNQKLDDLKYLYSLGIRDFGENRVQDLKSRSDLLNITCPDIRWHMIGHLQSNKIKELFSIAGLTYIHSVDSVDLVYKLEKYLENSLVKVFLQIKTSNETEKSGFESEKDLRLAFESLQKLNPRQPLGLMTMAPIRTADQLLSAKDSFLKLSKWAQLFENEFHIKLELSMGMSADFEVALEVGTDWVRIGSSLFID